MNRLKIAGLLVLGLQFTQSALADPVISLGQPLGGKTFAMFYMNNKKIDSSPAQELIALTNLLNKQNQGISPCMVNTDINAIGISCGGGLVKFVEGFYSNILSFNLKNELINLRKGLKQVNGSNFRSPTKLVPGDSVGRDIHIVFNKPVYEFAMNFDSTTNYNSRTKVTTGGSSIDSVKFLVNGAVVQSDLTPTSTQWVTVSDSKGMKDLWINPVGGDSSARAFRMNKFSVVTN
jgi:hypothetical protein